METLPGPFASPKWSLACSALERNTSIQRRPTITGDQAGLQSPIRERPPAIPETMTDDATKVEDIKATGSDSDSDVTLIEADTNKTTEVEGEGQGIVDKDASKSSTEVSPGNTRRSTTQSDSIVDEPDQPPKPNRPPPIPPRPLIGPINKPSESDSKDNNDSKLKSAAEDAARQQDVHEVMDNALFKLQCAFRSESDEEDEDGTDIIKR
jgi:hypothetical protein